MAAGKEKIGVITDGERLYDITETIRAAIERYGVPSGIAVLFCPHVSCALAIQEAYDPLAKADLEEFLKRLAPRDLPFIKHDDEGPDDSPSHMKSLLLQPSLILIIEQGSLLLGAWQGIYLAEFRDRERERELWLKVISDGTGKEF
jgi:secondary thiamine-phosphate synthase enzyme